MIGDVAGKRRGFAAGLRDRGRGALGRRLVDVEHRDLGAFLGKAPAGGAANAAAAAGHDDGLVPQASHARFLSLSPI